jgi:hypothetical protein
MTVIPFMMRRQPNGHTCVAGITVGSPGRYRTLKLCCDPHHDVYRLGLFVQKETPRGHVPYVWVALAVWPFALNYNHDV